MGAGTVAVVARNLNRHFIGAENDLKYYSVAMRRLAGEPDENGSFANLKTLRSYCERTGKSTSLFKFDVQVGKYATEGGKAKIYPEEHHLAEFEDRLTYEELAFGAKLRGHEVPVDPKLNGSGKATPVLTKHPSLFD
jgi:adenine-specific DNA-methyltransferase